MLKIAPSLLSADFTDLAKDIKILEEAEADMLHIDIMDGHFVPNITFGPDQIKQLRKLTSMCFDVHLMISEPDKYIPQFAEAGSDIITVHAETSEHLNRTIQLIKSFSVKAGVSFNPATPLNSLDYILDDIDLILIMSVNPGYGGQKFIPASLNKIKDAAKIIGSRDIMLEVDGGINLSTASEVVEAGANVLVAGSYTFNGNVYENIRKLREICMKKL